MASSTLTVLLGVAVGLEMLTMILAWDGGEEGATKKTLVIIVRAVADTAASIVTHIAATGVVLAWADLIPPTSHSLAAAHNAAAT
ncbi:hypothetical protein [Frankia sp. Cj3]|uniref:hypothetical protein n=1 Tax=Frankia sp. Cj3 TaxID=2880976 RepID=UPI001EF566DD|nr:hypothetical protein [Frankia sp. Cj3]